MQLVIYCPLFYHILIHQFSAFPINSQFTERGVKESGHVSLGRRNETHRSLLAISRAKIMPNALQEYRDDIKVESESESGAEDGEDDEDGEKKVKQLGGKRRAKYLMCGLFEHNKEMVVFKQSFRNEGDYTLKRKQVKIELTDSSRQFKKKRIELKVERVKERYNNCPNPNMYERRTGQSLTPLIRGQVQIYKCKKIHNEEAIRLELVARGMGDMLESTTYRDWLKMLKESAGGKTFFTPLTDYNAFKWLSCHFDVDGNVVDSQ